MAGDGGELAGSELATSNRMLDRVCYLGDRLTVGQVPFYPVRPKAGRTGGPEVDSRIFGQGLLLGDRLMVGQVPLEHFVQVRILVAQPEF